MGEATDERTAARRNVAAVKVIARHYHDENGNLARAYPDGMDEIGDILVGLCDDEIAAGITAETDRVIPSDLTLPDDVAASLRGKLAAANATIAKLRSERDAAQSDAEKWRSVRTPNGNEAAQRELAQFTKLVTKLYDVTCARDGWKARCAEAREMRDVVLRKLYDATGYLETLIDREPCVFNANGHCATHYPPDELDDLIGGDSYCFVGAARAWLDTNPTGDPLLVVDEPAPAARGDAEVRT